MNLVSETCTARGVHPDAVAAAHADLLAADAYLPACALFGALSDATRLRIVHALLDRELCTCEIASALRVSDSNVSQHLRILRALQLVSSRRDGKFVYYRVDDGHVGTILRMALSHLGHAPASAQAS